MNYRVLAVLLLITSNYVTLSPMSNLRSCVKTVFCCRCRTSNKPTISDAPSLDAYSAPEGKTPVEDGNTGETKAATDLADLILDDDDKSLSPQDIEEQLRIQNPITGETLLHQWALRSDFVKLIEALQDKGLENATIIDLLGIQTIDGNTPVHMTIEACSITRLFPEEKEKLAALFNKQNNDQNTWLHIYGAEITPDKIRLFGSTISVLRLPNIDVTSENKLGKTAETINPQLIQRQKLGSIMAGAVGRRRSRIGDTLKTPLTFSRDVKTPDDE